MDKPKDEVYNPLSSVFFNSEGGIIRSMFAPEGIFDISWYEIFTFIFVWLFFTLTTYGVWVPAGLFLPGIIIGCGIGALYGKIVEGFFDLINPNGSIHDVKMEIGEVRVYALLGATAMLSGFVRLNYSLVVIMLECTESVALFIPLCITLLTSYYVAKMFNDSLYSRALREKQVPILREYFNVPPGNRNLICTAFMKPDPTCL